MKGFLPFSVTWCVTRGRADRSVGGTPTIRPKESSSTLPAMVGWLVHPLIVMTSGSRPLSHCPSLRTRFFWSIAPVNLPGVGLEDY